MGRASSLSLYPRALLWSCLLASVSRVASATGSSYRLQVVRADGAGTCDSAAGIERDVAQRLGRNPFSDEGERGIDIVLSRVETKWVARLYLRIDANEADAARVIESEAADCAELGKSVALAVALAIAPELPPPPESRPEPSCPPPPPAPPAPASAPSLHGAVAVRALYSPNMLPKSAVGTALSVTLRGDVVGANLGGIFYPERELRAPAAQLGFGVSAAFVSGCLWARVRNPEVWSCIGARAGALHSVVYGPLPEQAGDHFWAAGAGELGLRQRLFARLFVEAGLAAVLPLLRYRFRIDDASTPIYEQGAAVVEGSLGLGLRLD